MTFTRAELHTMTVALMIAIDNIGRLTHAVEGVEIRADYLPRMRALLERFQN